MHKNMTKNELTVLSDLVRDKIGVEIGCGDGNITVELSKTCERIYAVNAFNKSNREVFIETVEDCKNVRMIESYSHLASKIFNDLELDFVFVDGNQNETGLIQNIEDFFPKLKIGGVIIFHDYTVGFFQNEVLQEVKEICDRYYTVHDGSVDSMIWIVKRNELNG